jgi:hypothetical protein
VGAAHLWSTLSLVGEGVDFHAEAFDNRATRNLAEMDGQTAAAFTASQVYPRTDHGLMRAGPALPVSASILPCKAR